MFKKSLASMLIKLSSIGQTAAKQVTRISKSTNKVKIINEMAPSKRPTGKGQLRAVKSGPSCAAKLKRQAKKRNNIKKRTSK